jgi:hypothetical protein
MFALSEDSYAVGTSTITVTGTMRSITRVADTTVEDVAHQYLAIAVDNTFTSVGPDRFDIHIKTPFWNTSNLLCTPSDKVAGGCRFGGQLPMGDVVVGSICGGLPS